MRLWHPVQSYQRDFKTFSKSCAVFTLKLFFAFNNLLIPIFFLQHFFNAFSSSKKRCFVFSSCGIKRWWDFFEVWSLLLFQSGGSPCRFLSIFIAVLVWVCVCIRLIFGNSWSAVWLLDWTKMFALDKEFMLDALVGIFIVLVCWAC